MGDIRKIGFRLNRINFSISIIIIANISLCGLPFIRGFYSKDLIIEIIIIKGKNLVIFILLIKGTMLTLLYSCRLNLLISINYIKILFYIRKFKIYISRNIYFIAIFNYGRYNNFLYYYTVLNKGKINYFNFNFIKNIFYIF